VQLPHLDAWADGRRAAGRHYEEAGLGELVDLPRVTDGTEPAWHLYVIRHDRADDLAAAFSERGIGCKAYYRVPSHLQPAMAEWGAGARLPSTDEAARTHLAIPMSTVLDAGQATEVTTVAREALVGATA
jgi:dTDP-4-amino-4,6-dideoxygalactose transaminase